MKKNYILLLSIIMLSYSTISAQIREYIDLSGRWQFQLDTANTGILKNLYSSDLSDSINLPGTTDINRKGFINKDTSTMHLNRLYKYEGAAWYRKKIVIPESMHSKHIVLFLERTKSSKIWIDSIFAGEARLLQSAQQFDVTELLKPGEHFITIRVDNSLKLTPYGNVHIYTDETQTNWNGIIGKLFLEATSKTFISNLQVYPDIENRKIDIKMEIGNQLKPDKIEIELIVEKSFNGKTTLLNSKKIITDFNNIIKLEYSLADECRLWDEFAQPVYNLTAIISNGEVKDSKSVPFGMRKFMAKGTQFTINGQTVFLRGKHDGAVFPLTGYTPMDEEAWTRVFKIAKSYGINHYRFHSYCPPEAAFSAADKEGVYIQAELPFWGGLESDSVASMLQEEGMAMLNSYANHPSFVMFSHGNEIWSGHERVVKNIVALKEFDNRLLYTTGSNNNIGYVAPPPCSDFFVGARTPYAGDSILTHTRLTHAFADSRDGGMLNTLTPSTEVDFNYSVSHMQIPVVSHEIGQYQIYPDYREIEKYTGVLKAWNLEIFCKRLEKAGMLKQNIEFQKASGAWAAICYKAEMEAALRTKRLAGFQLLDLQDYPGQGTALVGILDAFMEGKNVVSRYEWLQSCNDVVLLLEFKKYCWVNNESFNAKCIIANYSNKNIDSGLVWKISTQGGSLIKSGSLNNVTFTKGENTVAGEINIDLSAIKKTEKLTIDLSIPGTVYTNTYSVWVYPPVTEINNNKDIFISEKLDDQTLLKLEQGGKVLLFPTTNDVKDKSFSGLFPPEFWNYGMFKGISEWVKKPISPGTLGLLTDPAHPLFNSFPTGFHTDWQWFSIIKASNSLILDSIKNGYKPIVQVIDNLERNHKLGLIFEFKTGKGKLLVCMAQLNKIMDNPEAVQLYRSIISYLSSKDFNPAYEISVSKLKDIL